MSLSPGSRLGPYEIVAPLGAGGMGEVYRARDSRLDREVAVKVLPATFSQDPDRLRRFEQEARTAGSLNHPNVTAVYDIGTQDGSPYVVSELLEGETLRVALAGGRLSPRTAIDYSIQIAQGLAGAHEKGIVHRDLKPENLFVTGDGRVKILDFGLAKLTQGEEGKGRQTDLPTATPGTEPGVVLGTLGYMSPEQVKGKPADARSDIFSFGAILYEMLAGRRAFQGDSAAETMSAILREEPPDFSAADQNISPGLERVVRHCLEKNLERRFQSARDLAFDLEAMSGVSGPRPEPSALTSGPRRPAVWIAAAAAIAIALAGLLTGRLIWRAPANPPPSFHRLTYRRGFVSSARFAPDGQTIFYAASWDGAEKPQLFSTRVENPESLRLGLPDGYVKSISRSGEMLILTNSSSGGGYTRRGTLASAPLSGAAARELLEDVADADWLPDGKSFALVRAPGWRYRLEFPAGRALYETNGWISHPRVSPTGDAVAFLDHPVWGDDRGAVAIVDRSGKKTTLSAGWESAQGLAWSASGEEIWFTASEAGNARVLHAVTRSGRRRLIAGSPGVLTLQDISKDGRVLVDSANDRQGLLGILAADAKERDLSGLDWSLQPILSEDGKTLVFTEEGAGGGAGYSVYLRRLDNSPAVRLGEGEGLALSPDGKWVLASLDRLSPIPLVLLPSGAGESRPFARDSINHEGLASFFPDGRRILFVGSEPGHKRRCWIQDLDGGKPRPVSPEGVAGALLTSDGRFFVALFPDQKPALYPVDGGPARPIEGLEPGEVPLRWSADGKSLFVRPSRVSSLTARVYRVEVPGGRRELWKEFAPRDPTGLGSIGADAITPDGKTLVFRYNHRLSDLYVVDGLK